MKSCFNCTNKNKDVHCEPCKSCGLPSATKMYMSGQSLTEIFDIMGKAEYRNWKEDKRSANQSNNEKADTTANKNRPKKGPK